MKKIMRPLVLLSALLTLGLMTSCESDNKPSDDFIKYEKKSDNALLLVTFGSTFDEPHTTYAKQIEEFRKDFPGTDLFFSFTSRTCINRWQAKTKEQFITPDLWLEWFLKKNYSKVFVQSLHVIPGEEFTILRDAYVKPRYNFLAEELGRGAAILGVPLLTSDDDIEAVGKILVDAFAAQLRAGDAVAFMGHGNPEDQYEFANKSYEKIEKYMQEYAKRTYNNDNVYVGTVDYPAMLIDYVLKQLDTSTSTTKKIHLHPLMSIAGDHANNDMASPDTEEDGKKIPLEEQSWRNQIAAKGWTVECHIKGLGDYPAINKIWIAHLKEAIKNAE